MKEIEAESRERDCTKSDVVRERLQRGAGPASNPSKRLNLIADLIGSVDGLPADLSRRKTVRRVVFVMKGGKVYKNSATASGIAPR